VKIKKNRNPSNAIKAKKIISKGIERFTNNAGMVAIMGIISAAIYILLKQNNPSARFEKFSRRLSENALSMSALICPNSSSYSKQ